MRGPSPGPRFEHAKPLLHGFARLERSPRRTPLDGRSIDRTHARTPSSLSRYFRSAAGKAGLEAARAAAADQHAHRALAEAKRAAHTPSSAPARQRGTRIHAFQVGGLSW